MLMLLLMSQQMVSEIGSNKETNLLVSKCPGRGVPLKSKCPGRGVSEFPWRGVNDSISVYRQKEFPLEGGIMDSHLRGVLRIISQGFIIDIVWVSKCRGVNLNMDLVLNQIL